METVLVAETEPASLLALALVLRSLGYAVLEADTEDEALFTCCDYPGTIHAVLTPSVLDHRRNNLIQQLRSLRPQIRGLVICEAAEYPALTDSDGCIYLQKPFQLEDLADSMKRLLDCQAYQDVATSPEKFREPETWQTPLTSRDSISGFAVGQFSPAMRATLRWSGLTLVVASLVSVLLLSRRGSPISALPRFSESRKFALQSPSDKRDQPSSPHGNEKESAMVAQVTQMQASHRAQIKVRAPRRHYRRAVPTEPLGKAAAGFRARLIPVDASAKETRTEHPPVYSSAAQQLQTLSSAMGTNLGGEPAVGVFPAVSVQARAESQPSGLARKLSPLFRGFRPAPEFEPPSPIRKSTPLIGDALQHRLRSEVSLDVRVYINKSGKVDYAELLTDITDRNRDLATLAVFDARHWEFKPARSGTRIVPGRAILYYQFSTPEVAVSHDRN